MQKSISRRKASLIFLILGSILLPAAGFATSGWVLTTSQSVSITAATTTTTTTTASSAIVITAASINGTVPCTISGLSVSCPAESGSVGKQWFITLTVTNNGPTATTITPNWTSGTNGAVVRVAYMSPFAGTAINPGASQTFQFDLQAMGPGSDNIIITVTGT